MWSKAALAVFVGLVFTFIAFRFLPICLGWLGLAYSGLLLWLMIAARNTAGKAVLFNLAVVTATLAAFEFYLNIKNTPMRRWEGAYTLTYYDKVSDGILGFRPNKNTMADAREYYEDQLLYDVIYTIDADGLRISPIYAPDGSENCVIFFGGSYTFGEGVSDDETFAFRVGERLEGRYRIFNFGFHGYRAHQMLSALESGLVKSIADCHSTHVIYLGLVDHVRRSAGLALWDLEGPRYILTAEGVQRNGALFENYHLPLAVIGALKKSRLFMGIVSRLTHGIHDDDIDLYLAIISRSRELVEIQYRDADFHVIQWPPMPGEQPVFDMIIQGLEDRNIEVTPVADILPAIESAAGMEKYTILHDGHPTPLFHDELSAYIATQIVGESHLPR